jgi:hypothetical protein
MANSRNQPSDLLTLRKGRFLQKKYFDTTLEKPQVFIEDLIPEHRTHFEKLLEK